MPFVPALGRWTSFWTEPVSASRPWSGPGWCSSWTGISSPGSGTISSRTWSFPQPPPGPASAPTAYVCRPPIVEDVAQNLTGTELNWSHVHTKPTWHQDFRLWVSKTIATTFPYSVHMAIETAHFCRDNLPCEYARWNSPLLFQRVPKMKAGSSGGGG